MMHSTPREGHCMDGSTHHSEGREHYMKHSHPGREHYMKHSHSGREHYMKHSHQGGGPSTCTPGVL